MARKPKTSGPGHNLHDGREPDLLLIMSELRPARDAVEAAQAALKKAKNAEQVIRNKAETQGWTLSILDKALKREREPTNRRGQQAEADEEFFVMKTLGLPVAAVQGQMDFGSDEERDLAYWGDQGYQAGIRGDAATPPDACPPHAHQHWLNRRADGAEYSAWGKSEAGARVDRIAPRSAPPPAAPTASTIDAAEEEPGGDENDEGGEDAAPEDTEARTPGGRRKGAAAADPLLQ